MIGWVGRLRGRGWAIGRVTGRVEFSLIFSRLLHSPSNATKSPSPGRAGRLYSSKFPMMVGGYLGRGRVPPIIGAIELIAPVFPVELTRRTQGVWGKEKWS